MARYVVGDIQGCFNAFEALLQRIQFSTECDELWSVGDLINRGENNCAVLRWFYHHRDNVRVVLGNHDLHLLAVRAGVGRLSRSDNVQDILTAPDGDILMDWLQQQPLTHQEGPYTMVHAGIPPQWSTSEAAAYGQEVVNQLRGVESTQFLRAMYGNEPQQWSMHLKGLARLRVITNYLTRMRFCTASGRMDLVSKHRTPDTVNLQGEPLKPWFEHPNRLQPNEMIMFGHWAALEGRCQQPQYIALDTGCVWGNTLTAINLDTQQRISVPG